MILDYSPKLTARSYNAYQRAVEGHAFGVPVDVGQVFKYARKEPSQEQALRADYPLREVTRGQPMGGVLRVKIVLSIVVRRLERSGSSCSCKEALSDELAKHMLSENGCSLRS